MAARAYTTPTHTSSDCTLEVSGTPLGRMPFTAPMEPSEKPSTFSSKMVFNALCTWLCGNTCEEGAAGCSPGPGRPSRVEERGRAQPGLLHSKPRLAWLPPHSRPGACPHLRGPLAEATGPEEPLPGQLVRHDAVGGGALAAVIVVVFSWSEGGCTPEGERPRRAPGAHRVPALTYRSRAAAQTPLCPWPGWPCTSAGPPPRARAPPFCTARRRPPATGLHSRRCQGKEGHGQKPAQEGSGRDIDRCGCSMGRRSPSSSATADDADSVTGRRLRKAGPGEECAGPLGQEKELSIAAHKHEASPVQAALGTAPLAVQRQPRHS